MESEELLVYGCFLGPFKINSVLAGFSFNSFVNMKFGMSTKMGSLFSEKVASVKSDKYRYDHTSTKWSKTIQDPTYIQAIAPANFCQSAFCPVIEHTNLFGGSHGKPNDPLSMVGFQ